MNTEKSTKDLDLAAAYLAVGAEYVRADKSNPKNIEFYFAPREISKQSTIGAIATLHIPTQDLDRVEAEWTNETLVVNAVKYAQALKRLKGIIHSR